MKIGSSDARSCDAPTISTAQDVRVVPWDVVAELLKRRLDGAPPALAAGPAVPGGGARDRRRAPLAEGAPQ